MNLPIDRLMLLAKNPHTSICAVIYVTAKYGSRIASAWFPSHIDAIHTTADAMEGAAVAWGLLMAGDAKQSVSQDQANTTFIRKAGASVLPTTQQIQTPKSQ